MVLEQVDVPRITDEPEDRSEVIVKVLYAGFCGSDRGIWWRKAFGDMVLGSLDNERKDRRIFGHELLGEIVDVGARVTEKYGYRPGEIVSTESHIVCGTCLQCRLGEYHVCARDRIIGISLDGCFAEYVKLPAKALWRTDLERIRPEVAAIQEPFGNAMHACQVTDLRGKTVAILGTGTIGLFALLIARGMGARKVIGIEVSPERREQAAQLGCDLVLDPGRAPEDRPWGSSASLREQVMDATDGAGVDIAMEMAGFNSSVNNAISITRRGGHVVLFGVQNGNQVFQDAHRIIMNGLQLHGVVGRRIFQTWHMTRALLENRDNGIQDAIWNVILNRGEGTLVDIQDWERNAFEQVISKHPKAILRFAGT
ncbi:MAG: zinc-binding dehydrogenase [Myxococcota bacterium]